VLANFTSGNQGFYKTVTQCRPLPHQDWGRSRTAGNRLAHDEKELGSQLGGKYPENGLVKPPRRDKRARSPADMFGGKAPHRLAAQKSRPHARLAHMNSTLTFFANRRTYTRLDYCTFTQGKIIRFSIVPGDLQSKGLRTAFQMQKQKLQRTRCSNAKVIRRPAGC
jgi:hypothetical protein